MKKSKWTQEQIEILTEKAGRGSIRTRAFEEVARQTNRKANSVRNFYYKYLASEKAKFVPFTASAVKEILREIVLGTSRGESVRSICIRLAGGNKSKMLRVQNKYRSFLRTKPQAIEAVKDELESQGYLVKSPVKANIFTLPTRAEKRLDDSDINNLFMGLMRLIKNRAEEGLRSQIAVLKAEIERLKTAAGKQVK